MQMSILSTKPDESLDKLLQDISKVLSDNNRFLVQLKEDASGIVDVAADDAPDDSLTLAEDLDSDFEEL